MFELPAKALEIKDEVEAFFNTRILPNNKLWLQQAQQGQSVPEIEQTLKLEAKELGLWNMALPRLTEGQPGLRLSNLEFTGVAEILGRLEWASNVFNCHAPDVPNMELLQLFATTEQKEQWLKPLLDGDIGSAFAMTEPHVASSDPVNLETSITRDGDCHQWQQVVFI
jgi:acyl-CoA dehydrogenase